MLLNLRLKDSQLRIPVVIRLQRRLHHIRPWKVKQLFARTVHLVHIEFLHHRHKLKLFVENSLVSIHIWTMMTMYDR